MAKTIVYRRVSFSDLEAGGYTVALTKHNGQPVIDVTKSTKGIYEALKFMGLKINNLLEIQGPNEHVRVNGKRTFSYSFVGEERNDKEWLMSGYASEEVKLSSSKMSDMLETVGRLKRGEY